MKSIPSTRKSPSRLKQREALQDTYINEAYHWVAEQRNTYRSPFGEADDLLHCWAIKFRYRPYYVLVSVDKDLLQVPGHHFNPRRDTYSCSDMGRCRFILLFSNVARGHCGQYSRLQRDRAGQSKTNIGIFRVPRICCH